MDRTKFGIQGLDKALEGGVPFGNLVLISGGAGTGKSTLCLQFLVNGATLFGEKALYISTEQSVEELQKHAGRFGWDLRELEEKNLLRILYFDITRGNNFLQDVDKTINEFKPKRLASDSMTTLTDSLIIGGMREESAFSLVQVVEKISPIPRTEQIIAKSILYKLISELKKYNLTTLLTSELYEEAKSLSADGISEFIADGVILLHYIEIGVGDYRSMEIRKMRYSDYDKDIIPYDITDKGIKIVEEGKSKI
jgi:circadian clock protein KaiC